jgi:hypothetical protein
MAIKKTIEIDVDVVRANGGLENFTQNFKKSEEAAKSLRTQLREAQAEVATLSDKFGATSREAVEAAKRAAELKDRIGDAKSLTEAFNPDAKFKALSASLSGVAGGFAAYQGAMGLVGVESKDLEKQLLKVQSAMAIATGLQQLGEARDSFKQLKAVAVNALNGIKTAIGATGIGLLVVALGAVYTYWDDIKEAVSGVNSEQKKLNANAQKNVELQNEKLKSLNDQDNILKLQGKTEKQILQYKIAQTDEAINAQNILIATQIESNKQAVESTKRNKGMLQSMLDFINKPLEFFWRKSSQFINATLKVLDKIGIKVDVGLNEDMLKDFNAKAGELTSNYVFDEKETKAEGEKVLKEQQEALTKLKNDRAGYQLAINDIDKTAADNAAKTAEEKSEIEKSRLEKLNDLYASYLETNEEASAVTEQEKLDLQKQRDLKEINELAKTENEKSNLTALLNEKYFNLQLELDKKLAEEKDKINKQKISDQDAEWLRLQEFTMQKNEYEKLVLTQKYEAEYLAAEGNAALQTELKKKLEKDLGDIDDKAKQEAKEKEQALLSAKLAFAQQGLSLVAEIAGKGSKIGKAVAVAQATISGIEGVQNAYTTAQKSPITIGFPAYPVVQASLAGVFAALQIRKILSTNVGSASASSVGGGGGGGSAPAPPQFNIVGQSSTNQLSQTIAGQQNRPIQTYVVGSQVSTQQSLDRNAVANSTFG